MVKKKVGVLKVIDLNYTLLILLALILGCKETPIIIDKDSTIQIASISSSILDMDVNYSVYLPPSYESGGPFPVLYLLHGYYGNHLDWPRNGMRQIMDRELNSGNSTEMIVIMPDGMDSFYIDDFDERKLDYEQFFFQEFVPELESKFNIVKVKTHRGIAGLSMGGYGAITYGLKYHHLFSFAYSMSGVVFLDEKFENIFEIVNSKTSTELTQLPKIFLDCGTEDFLFDSNDYLSNFLTQKNIEHTFIKGIGAHEWSYWVNSLSIAINEFSTSLLSN
ncbi:alpha/beta hydrolase-fold protein [Balneolaceae bacterium]|nr:alpha/beta hydrolase-fold protein [Balneolaceae bacterium]